MGVAPFPAKPDLGTTCSLSPSHTWEEHVSTFAPSLLPRWNAGVPEPHGIPSPHTPHPSGLGLGGAETLDSLPLSKDGLPSRLCILFSLSQGSSHDLQGPQVGTGSQTHRMQQALVQYNTMCIHFL